MCTYIALFILVTDPCDGCVRNSTCEPQPDGSVECICPGYNGRNCDNYRSCHSDPCMNGGICTEIVGNFTYTCVLLVTGRFCEVDPDDECNPAFCEVHSKAYQTFMSAQVSTSQLVQAATLLKIT